MRIALRQYRRSAATIVAAAIGLMGGIQIIGCRGTEPPPNAGRIAWKTDGQAHGTPVFDDSLVYFQDPAHGVLALSKSSGAIRWRQTADEAGAGTGGHSAVLAGANVIVGDVNIHAFDRYTGIRRWRFVPGEGYSPGLFRITTDGQAVYAGSPSGRAYAIVAATGVQKWMAVIATDNNTSVFDPVLSDGTVYLCVVHFTTPRTGGIVALDASTGATRWSRDFPQFEPSNQGGCQLRAAVTQTLVIGSSFDGHIFAFDKNTGAPQWTIPQLGGLPDGTGGSPLNDIRPVGAIGGTLIAGSTTGYIAAFDATTGAERWRATAHRGSVVYPLALDEQRVYTLNGGLQLGVFDLTTGQLLWRAGEKTGGGEFVYAPAVDTDRLYVSGLTGFYALNSR